MVPGFQQGQDRTNLLIDQGHHSQVVPNTRSDEFIAHCLDLGVVAQNIQIGLPGVVGRFGGTLLGQRDIRIPVEIRPGGIIDQRHMGLNKAKLQKKGLVTRSAGQPIDGMIADEAR